MTALLGLARRGILAAMSALALVTVGTAIAAAQDFSITNQAEPANPARRDLVRQLQAWWDQHAFYPRHASSNDEGGTVKVHLTIRTDGIIWKIDVVGSSGSASLDAAAQSAFRAGFVRPFAPDDPPAELDLTLHYVLAHRHDQPVPAGFKPTPSGRPFTITNDPVHSPVLETMLQRTCTGTVVKEGIRNHPWYGGRHWAEAVFFRKPDGTSWVKFNDGGEPLIAPVFETGKMVQWTGKTENPRKNVQFYYQYTVWKETETTLIGNIEAYFYDHAPQGINTGGTVDFTCATETVPAIPWNPSAVRTYQAPPLDPP